MFDPVTEQARKIHLKKREEEKEEEEELEEEEQEEEVIVKVKRGSLRRKIAKATHWPGRRSGM